MVLQGGFNNCSLYFINIYQYFGYTSSNDLQREYTSSTDKGRLSGCLGTEECEKVITKFGVDRLVRNCIN